MKSTKHRSTEELNVGDVVRIEGLVMDARGRLKFLKKGKCKGVKLKVVAVGPSSN